MAHEKLSPRQRMIGMMYLVLTAMLALNVSKEAVEAFKKVDNSLTLTIANYGEKNNLIYKEFDRAAAENPTKAGAYKTKAYELKERADEIFNYMQGLKIEIIKEAERDENTPAVRGNEVIIDEVKRIDENNVPSQILIGANENGKAFALKTMLVDFREFLIETLEGKNPTAEEALRKSLNTDDGRDPGGDPERWENLTFHNLPLVAVITVLSKMQVDVRNSETEVLNHLYSQIDAASFKFNKLEAIVIPDANYVTLGSTYSAKVFISATDTTQKPKIMIGDQALPIDETGKGIYSVKPSTTGAKAWGGVINLKSPDGTDRNYPFKASYSVGVPNVVVSPTAMNVMYLNIPNPIDVSVPGISPDNIKIKVVNGTFTTERVRRTGGEFFRGNWAVKPTAVGQNVQIIVSATEPSGRTTQYPPYDFRVKRIPKPEARFAGQNGGTITRNTAVAQQGVFAILPDFDFDLQYKVTGFSILYTDRLGDFEEPATGSSLTPRQRDLLTRLTRGKYLTIKDIKAIGPDNNTIDLSPMLFKID
jgi:gliding motility-associated protein GldM